jgi:hypothetical protein
MDNQKSEKIMELLRQEVSDLRRKSYPQMSLNEAVKIASEYMLFDYSKEELKEAIINDRQLQLFGMEKSYLKALGKAKKMAKGSTVKGFKVGDDVIFNVDPSGRLSNDIYYGTILEIDGEVAKIDHINNNMKNVIRSVNVANLKKYGNGGALEGWGGTSESSQDGMLIGGTNAELTSNQYGKGGGVKRTKTAEEIYEEEQQNAMFNSEYGNGGMTSGWCYSIGGL